MLGGEQCDQGLCSSLDSFMPTGFKNEIQNAFNAWSSVANLNFFEKADDGADWNATTTSGDIKFGGEVMDGASGTLAHGYYTETQQQATFILIPVKHGQQMVLVVALASFGLLYMKLVMH
jgi:hypothetical protein